jgi:hypothetical protein
MKVLPTLSALILAISIVGCQPTSKMLARLTGYYTKPKNETNESIMAYCDKYDAQYDQLYKLKSDDDFKEFVKKYPTIPGVFLFDKEKRMITVIQKKDCKWGELNALYNDSIEKIVENDTLLFNDVLSYFLMIDDKTQIQNADFYVFEAWAKYFPKFAKGVFEDVNKQRAQNKLNICHILLNCDKQKDL